MLASRSKYPAIADYGLIADCHSAALVSRHGSIDWCCMPRFDSGSSFGRLLDWDRGGYCSITPKDPDHETARRYLDGTLVLETTFRTGAGEVRVVDCFTMRRGGDRNPHRQILRVVEGVRGSVDLQLQVVPRFDYGEVRPWVRKRGVRHFTAIGGDDGLLISADADIEQVGRHDLAAILTVRAGHRIRISLQYAPPDQLDPDPPDPPEPEELDRRLDETVRIWRRWSERGRLEGPHGPPAVTSALVLKALTYAPTGAIVAAPTTSLPEAVGGGRNWDYRYSWIRDSSFTLRSLGELGYETEADGFRRFVERSAAGNAEDLQIVFGVGGERRLVEVELDGLEGYKRSRPVRAGNSAYRQDQHDVYGELLALSWRWHERGASPDDDYWQFLVDLVDAAAARWRSKDPGLWEMRANPQHFTHSKVMCWAALEYGIRLARECHRRAPTRRWTATRNEIREAVERRGYDRRRGIFVQAFGSKELDAALLLLPNVGFVAWDDERMVRTIDAVWEELGEDDLIWRYRGGDGLEEEEGAFLACSFWLVECLARQGRVEEAQRVFDRAVSTGNDLGLFSEESSPSGGHMLGNFPQGLTHLSHIAAAVAMTQAAGD